VTASDLCNRATVQLRRFRSPISTAVARGNGPRLLTCKLPCTAPARAGGELRSDGAIGRQAAVQADVSRFEVVRDQEQEQTTEDER
jgi:hypothetical protein